MPRHLSLLLITVLFVLAITVTVSATTNTRYAIAARGPNNTILGFLFDNYQTYIEECNEALNWDLFLANASFAPTGNVTGWNVFRATGNQRILKEGQFRASPAQRMATRNSSDANMVYKAIGFLEGFLAPQEIVDSFLNVFFMPNPKSIDNFMLENQRFITNVLCNPARPLPENATGYGDEYILQVCKMYSQLQGVAEGIQKIIKMDPSKKPWNLPKDGGFNFHRVWMLNTMASFMDYFVACNVSMMLNPDHGSEDDIYSQQLLKSKKYFKHTNLENDDNSMMKMKKLKKFHPTPQQEKYILNEHCSALVKVTEDDVQMWHASWAQFNNLIRKFAVLELETTFQYSSLAVGLISSGDDYLVNIDHDLFVTETTFQQGNTELTQKYVTPWTVPEFMRSVIATQLATTGEEWSKLYLGPLNSGTYCNSWLVLTKSLVERSSSTGKMRISKLNDGALYLVEQMPGPYSVAQDITHILRNQLYFPGYNIPFAKSIYNLSGQLSLEEKYGSYFSFNHTARANIFRRDQHTVKDLQSGQALMRSNRFKTDPLSVIPGCIKAGCHPVYNPTLDVAARGDLTPVNQTFGTLNPYFAGFFAPMAFAAIDVKGTSLFNMMTTSSQTNEKSYIISAQSGPTTFDGNPPLIIPLLAPDLQMKLYGTYQGPWNFPFQNFSSIGMMGASSSSSSSSVLRQLYHRRG